MHAHPKMKESNVVLCTCSNLATKQKAGLAKVTSQVTLLSHMFMLSSQLTGSHKGLNTSRSLSFALEALTSSGVPQSSQKTAESCCFSLSFSWPQVMSKLIRKIEHWYSISHIRKWQWSPFGCIVIYWKAEATQCSLQRQYTPVEHIRSTAAATTNLFVNTLVVVHFPKCVNCMTLMCRG